MDNMGWIKVLPNEKNPTEGIFRTERYELSFKELKRGGPGGYESTYLVGEGYTTSEELYSALEKLSGNFLPVDNRLIRHRNGETFLDALLNEKQLGIASGFNILF